MGEDLHTYPPIPKDWYKGPTEHPHAYPKDWLELKVSYKGEEPRSIKAGVQLTPYELESYRALVMEYRNVFAWSYKDLTVFHPGWCNIGSRSPPARYPFDRRSEG